ncbi:hypothetical protein [Sphingomonas sp. Leaf198]|uniref:hypothetical protein n=1 Tax=Sphingomonas sp. Leaf198 TaxID=1736299 RepID=UPI0012E22052|nr:hypothetical protein [Sphingomonas sp. Leaf198]
MSWFMLSLLESTEPEYAHGMADFDDCADPELGAACNRLAAWVEPMPEGLVIDPASGLTEEDLAIILRRLYATREDLPAPILSMDEVPRAHVSPSVPLTKRGRWG